MSEFCGSLALAFSFTASPSAIVISSPSSSTLPLPRGLPYTVSESAEQQQRWCAILSLVAVLVLVL